MENKQGWCTKNRLDFLLDFFWASGGISNIENREFYWIFYGQKQYRVRRKYIFANKKKFKKYAFGEIFDAA